MKNIIYWVHTENHSMYIIDIEPNFCGLLRKTEIWTIRQSVFGLFNWWNDASISKKLSCSVFWIWRQIFQSYTNPNYFFYSAFATSFTMEWVNNKFGRKITAIFGALVGIFGCLWMRYGCIPGDPSVQYHVFFVAILLGITNLSLIIKLLIICWVPVRTQRPRIDLNKRFLPRSNTTTAWNLIPHRSNISKN